MSMSSGARMAGSLPVGFHSFHRKRFFNYQLNRLHALGFARKDEIEYAANRVRTTDDWVREFDALSARTEREDRVANAAFYARAAEFFTPPRTIDKRTRYERFIDLFDRAFADQAMTRHLVPYADSVLPARHLVVPPAENRGTVVFFGGFDSIVEEFFGIWRRFAHAGFEVIAFDGPGQGGARVVHGQIFDHDWERPVGAVLDHFNLDNVALVGMSMGGYWAIRAAAYEPRVARVVSWPPVYDWLERVPSAALPIIRTMLGWRRYMNANVRLRTRLSPVLRHVVAQAMYIVDGAEPIDAVRWFLGMNAAHLGSERVTQDVALVGGERDAFQPPKLLHLQAEALTNAASVTTRIFTVAEHADQHCQMGNLELATEWVTAWLQGRVDQQADRH
jgi:pimeloyl-ACP methyl ester carboxylesterase